MKTFNKTISILVFLLSLTLLANAQYSMKVGYTQYLSITPPKGTVRNSTWQCDEGLVLTDRSEVGAIVKVSHYFSGSAYVHCQYSYEYLGTYDKNWHAGTGTQTYRITCIAGSASISKTSLEMTPGSSYKLSCTKSESYGTPTWESSNEDVATVDKNGKVTALQSGYARITLDPIVAAPLFCDVTVKTIPPTSVSITPNPLTIDNGTSGNLTAALYPKGATAKLSWTSSNEEIATVSTSGVVTGHKAGNAVIVVKTDNGLSATANVTVNKTKVKLSCSATGGSVVTQGTMVSLSADADNARIYYTLNGNLPTKSSSLYTGPIRLNGSCTLKAIACADGYLDSDILTQEFKVTTLVAESTIPENGEQNVQYFTVPTIKFNGNIKEGKNLSNVVLDGKLEKGNEAMDVRCYTFRNELIIEPVKNLTRKEYTLTVPQGAVMNENGEENVPISISFSTSETSIDRFIYYTDSNGTTTFAIKNDKSVWGCGLNNLAYQLGLNTTKDQKSFVQCDFYDLKKLKRTLIGKGQAYYYLQNDGKLLAKGKDYGSVSKTFEFLTDVKDIAIEYYYGLALKTDGSIWTWGKNEDGRLGMETTNKTELYPIHLMDGVKKIFVASDASYVIKDDNSLWAWGGNYYGQIGNGQTTTVKTPTFIMNDVDSIACFDYHVLALKKDGTLWGWGNNRCGTIGIGNSNDSSKPIRILSNIREAYTNRNKSYAITNDGVLYTWGWNDYGQIGAGETGQYVYTPTKVLTDVEEMKLAGYSCTALKTDGTLWTCGRNKFGDLGDGTKIVRKTFKKITDNVRFFERGSGNLFILKNDNTLWGCGDNSYGQLGNGTTTESSSLKKIMDDVKVFEGITQGYATKTDGSIWAWGNNRHGTLGVGQNAESITSPVMLQAPFKELLDYSTAYVKDMTVGERQAVTLDVCPKDASIKELIWESDNPDVLSVNSRGVLEAKKVGSAKFTVYVKADSGMEFDSEGDVVIKPSATGIKMLEAAERQVSISVESGNLTITSATSCDICVYGIDGKLLFKKDNTKDAVVSKLTRGEYIVKVGRQVRKIVVN